MSSQAILNEDWSDYDNRKLRWSDRLYFSCEQNWEVNYLVDKIRKHHPDIAVRDIRAAMGHCCQAIRSPRARHFYVECVMKRLGRN